MLPHSTRLHFSLQEVSYAGSATHTPLPCPSLCHTFYTMHLPRPLYHAYATPPLLCPSLCHTFYTMPLSRPLSSFLCAFHFQLFVSIVFRVSGSNILEYFVSQDNLTEPCAAGCIGQLLQALLYLHQRNVAHFSIRVSAVDTVVWNLPIVDML